MEDFVTWHNARTVNRIDSEDECSCNLKEEYNKLKIGVKKMKKATILKYYQVVDEDSCTIDNAHTYKQALRIKKDYEE